MDIGKEQDPIEVPKPLAPGQVPPVPVPQPAPEPEPEPAVPDPVPGAARYQRKAGQPFTALPWTGENLPEIQALIGKHRAHRFCGGPKLLVVTLGDRVIGRGDWVMLFDTGEVRVCSAEDFAQDHEPAPDVQQETAGQVTR